MPAYWRDSRGQSPVRGWLAVAIAATLLVMLASLAQAGQWRPDTQGIYIDPAANRIVLLPTLDAGLRICDGFAGPCLTVREIRAIARGRQ